MNFILINNDCFNIVKRIKSIDKNYRLVFNAQNNCLQLYYLNKLQLTFPFKTLDYRVLEWVYKTLNANFETLSKEIDLANEINEKNKINDVKNEIFSTVESGFMQIKRRLL